MQKLRLTAKLGQRARSLIGELGVRRTGRGQELHKKINRANKSGPNLQRLTNQLRIMPGEDLEPLL